ncbi:replication initiation protein [Cupriavidus sp. UGS-1]|uniref:replication initiation protein n=1 Tax=Cupriavidus sp. UGS-1 TaxID=2899826 RepID=UPI001E41CAB7|nr:replication initiation protein [Cupriavidus sp. UGS-1]MCD9124019.1 replication initiation protein [Cupriavidus sp. UGS-1]
MNRKLAIEDAESPLPERQVNMANQLIRAAQGLKLNEKRLISCAIAKCDSVTRRRLTEAVTLGPDGHAAGWTVRLAVRDFIESFPSLNEKSAYADLEQAARSIYERSIRVQVETRRGPKLREYRWTSENQYHYGEGWVEIHFTGQVAPFLLGIEGEFTKYKLKHAADLRSVYSWRLLEMFAQYRNTGLVRIGFDDFCHAMEAPPSCVKDFAQLRRRIIEPAVAELTGKDGLQIEWKAVKQGGRKVTGLEFKFEPNPQLFLL